MKRKLSFLALALVGAILIGCSPSVEPATTVKPQGSKIPGQTAGESGGGEAVNAEK